MWTICASSIWINAKHHAKKRPAPRVVKISGQDATVPVPIHDTSAAAPHCHQDLHRFGPRNLRRTSYVYVCMRVLMLDQCMPNI
jgi:hypothetical protein